MKRFFGTLIRNLVKNPTFGFVTIGGFAFSLAIALLLSSYVFNEFSYDKFYPNLNRIYRLGTSKGLASFKGEQALEFIDKYPEIDKVCRYDNNSIDISYDKEPYSLKYLVKTDKDFFDIFSVRFKYGNSKDPLPQNESIVISASLAKSIFGDENPVGKSINIQHRNDYTITGVFEDLSPKSSIQAQAIVKWENVNKLAGEWRNGDYYSRIFFLLNEKGDPLLLEDKISKDYSEGHFMKQPFKLLPFRESYLSGWKAQGMSATLHADLKSIILFSIVTILILLISILNFTILFTSNHLTRLKEIGIKKTTGAGKKDIFKQFILESLIISSMAFILSILLAYTLKAFFISLIQKDFPLLMAFHFPNVLFVVLGVMIIGVMAGFYPAIIISGYKPTSIFGISAKKEALQIKNGLSVVQYFISIVLIVSLVVMARQNNLLRNKDVGFTKEQLVHIKIGWEVKDKLPVIKERLLNNPYIKSCAVSHGIPGQVSLWNFWNDAKEQYAYEGNMPYFTVDPDFFKVYNAEFLQGRDFEERDWERSVIMNEAAFKLTGWESIEGKELKGIPTPEQAFNSSAGDAANNRLNVIGVIRDINVEKLDQHVKPTIFECSDHFGITYLTCRVLPGDYPKVISDIKNVWQDVCPDFVFDCQFYDQWLNALYQQEIQSAYVIRVFAILSIILTCLGSFGVIHFVSRRKVKEIGVRKVNGAKIFDIVKILNWNITKWILVAFLMATPFSYFMMKMYLSDFAYKTDLDWWIFAFAGIGTLVIAFLTVSWQSWKAASRNPVEALRYE